MVIRAYSFTIEATIKVVTSSTKSMNKKENAIRWSLSEKRPTDSVMAKLINAVIVEKKAITRWVVVMIWMRKDSQLYVLFAMVSLLSLLWLNASTISASRVPSKTMQVIQIASFAVRQLTEFSIQQETLLNISKKSNDSLKKRYLNKMINKMEASVRVRNQITKLLIAHSQNKARRRNKKGK